MKEELISFETAKLAKAKGFIVPVKYYYDFKGDKCCGSYKTSWNLSKSDLYATPTQSLLQKWLREKHDIHIIVIPHLDVFRFKVLTKYGYQSYFKSNYEEALETGLQEALKLI